MLKQISDRALLENIQALVKTERLTLEQILEHLEEIQRRRLYADLGYSSLFKYLVKELKYSEGAAARRISALHLIRKVPSAKRMIAAGELNLTVASQAQQFTKQKDAAETRSVLNLVKGKTKDEATLALLELAPSGTAAESLDSRSLKHKNNERKDRVTPTETRIHLTVSNKALDKLAKLKAMKKLSSEEAIVYALDQAIHNLEKSWDKVRLSKGTKGRAIPSAMKKTVLKRAKHACEFPGCMERKNLEFEHVTPYALGGRHEVSNLKLYCRVHNQRAAIVSFGQATMDRYLNL